MSISKLSRRLLSSVAFGTLIATGVIVISRCSPSTVCTNIDPVTLAFAEETIPDAALELILSAAVNLDEDDSAECLAVVRHPDGERLIVFDDASGHVSIALQLDFIGAASRPGNDSEHAESSELWNAFQQKIRRAVPNSSQAESRENGLVPTLHTQNLDSEARLRIIQSLQLIRLPYNSSPSLFIQFPAQEFAGDKPESAFRVYTNLRLSFDLEIRQSEWPVAERYYFNGFEFVSCAPKTVCAALTDFSMQMSDPNDWEMRFEFRRLFDDEAMEANDRSPKVMLEFPAGGSAQLDRRRPGLDISSQPRVQYALPPECAPKACAIRLLYSPSDDSDWPKPALLIRTQDGIARALRVSKETYRPDDDSVRPTVLYAGRRMYILPLPGL